jgi:hypothetical protein
LVNRKTPSHSPHKLPGKFAFSFVRLQSECTTLSPTAFFARKTGNSAGKEIAPLQLLSSGKGELAGKSVHAMKNN